MSVVNFNTIGNISDSEVDFTLFKTSVTNLLAD